LLPANATPALQTLRSRYARAILVCALVCCLRSLVCWRRCAHRRSAAGEKRRSKDATPTPAPPAAVGGLVFVWLLHPESLNPLTLQRRRPGAAIKVLSFFRVIVRVSLRPFASASIKNMGLPGRLNVILVSDEPQSRYIFVQGRNKHPLAPPHVVLASAGCSIPMGTQPVSLLVPPVCHLFSRASARTRPHRRRGRNHFADCATTSRNRRRRAAFLGQMRVKTRRSRLLSCALSPHVRSSPRCVCATTPLGEFLFCPSLFSHDGGAPACISCCSKHYYPGKGNTDNPTFGGTTAATKLGHPEEPKETLPTRTKRVSKSSRCTVQDAQDHLGHTRPAETGKGLMRDPLPQSQRRARFGTFADLASLYTIEHRQES